MLILDACYAHIAHYWRKCWRGNLPTDMLGGNVTKASRYPGLLGEVMTRRHHAYVRETPSDETPAACGDDSRSVPCGPSAVSTMMC